MAVRTYQCDYKPSYPLKLFTPVSPLIRTICAKKKSLPTNPFPDLKFMRGEPLEQIREAAYNEIIELRDSNCPEEDTDEIEISIDDPLQTICVEEEISIEEVQLDDCDDDEIKKSDLNAHEFAPINNDKDLSLFVRKIKKSRKYRKEVQFKLIEEAPKGVLMLEQIFTLEFLQQFGAFHDFGRTRFMKLEPYKCLYQGNFFWYFL